MKTQEYFKIIDSPKLKTSEIVEQLKSKFSVRSYLGDEELDKQFPPPVKETTRYFLKTIEPDKALRNKSADDLDKEGVKCITLRERLLMELDYFNETGEHLDIKGWTICAGSRYSGGGVPCVCWDPGRDRLRIDWYLTDGGSDDCAARAEVLSPNSFPLEPSLTSDLEHAIKVVKEAGYVIYKEIN